MTIQPIGSACAALYFTPSDLRGHGVPPDAPTDDEILHLTRQTLSQAGLPLPGPLELDACLGRSGLLVVVRSIRLNETLWRFDSFDDLLSAAGGPNSGALCGALYSWDGSYWLALSPSEGQSSAHLSEFACPQEDEPYILARLGEYGSPLLTGRVFSTLQAYF